MRSERTIPRRTLLLIALTTVACLVSASRAAPDISTPKKAGAAFAKALLEGDIETIHQVSIGTEPQFAIIKGSVEMLRAMRRFEAAAVKKFGDQGKLDEQMSGGKLVAEFEAADEKIEGDKAVLILKSQPDSPSPPTFKKVAGGWKMDLAELSKSMPSEGMVKAVPMVVAALDGVAKDVEAGKYKTAAEAKTDMQTRMFGAMMAAQGGRDFAARFTTRAQVKRESDLVGLKVVAAHLLLRRS